jgi:hypothetical protein
MSKSAQSKAQIVGTVEQAGADRKAYEVAPELGWASSESRICRRFLPGDAVDAVTRVSFIASPPYGTCPPAVVAWNQGENDACSGSRTLVQRLPGRRLGGGLGNLWGTCENLPDVV